MKNLSYICTGLLVAALSAGCGNTPPGETNEGGSGGAPAGPGSGAGGDGGDGGDPAVPCPAPTSGPTLHAGGKIGDEVWSADASPHVVQGRVDITGGATLTIEPCAIVELAEGVVINVAFPGTPTTGTLLAEGTADQPIVFRGLDGARWGRIYVYEPGVARLSHVTFVEGGGADLLGATIVMMGDGVLPTYRGLFVDHVTVKGSLGTALMLDGLTGFADGSQQLTITESGNDDEPFPLRINEHAIDSLPSGDYTGNTVDEILVAPTRQLVENTRMRDLGVPYRIGRASVDRLVVGLQTAPELTTLTIDPGVTLKFHPGTWLRIEHATGAFPAAGALVAVGTAAKPITFTSAQQTPQPGDWGGLWFGGIVAPQTTLAHTQILYTGADCGCVLSTCSAIDAFEGAVIMTQQPPSGFVRDSLIAHGSGHAFVLGYTGTPVDFSEKNVFQDLGGCDAILPSMPTCPDPRPACQ